MLKTIIIFYVRALRAHAEFFSVTFKSQNPAEGAEENDISLPEQPETPPAEEEASPQGQALHNAAQTGGQIQPAEGGAGPEDQPAEAAQGQMSTVAAPPKKKRRWIWNIVLIAVIALGLWSLFSIAGEVTDGDGMTFAEAMNSLSVGGVIGLVCAVLAVMVVDSLKFCFVNKAVIGRVRPGVAIKTSFLGKFYDNITPFATGGQPMQIYYMTTKGVDVSNSSAVVLIRYFGSIFGFTLIGAVCMICGAACGVLDGVSGRTLLLVCGWVGLAVNLILPIFIAFFVFFPKLAGRCTTWFINMGVKLRIVKNKEKVMAKAHKIVDDFVVSFKIIVKKPLWLVMFLVCCFAENFLTFAMPWFVMNAFSCDVDGMFFAIMCLNVYATFGVSFIPTPGNSGVIEGMGVLAFSVAAGAALAWSVLFWRFAAYYIYIIIGIVITVVDLIIKNIKDRKQGN